MKGRDLLRFLDPPRVDSRWDLTNVLNLSSHIHLWTKITTNGPLKYFHHDAKQGPCEGCVPPALRMFVSDEGMLSLDFEEL
jgi:hypothetical protein